MLLKMPDKRITGECRCWSGTWAGIPVRLDGKEEGNGHEYGQNCSGYRACC